MTLVERTRNMLASLGETVVVADSDRHKPRPAFTPPPEPLGPYLRDVLAALEECER